MPKVIDLIGNKYGKLIVIERAINSTDGKAQWKCKCECGNHSVVKAANLKKRVMPTISCGCISGRIQGIDNVESMSEHKKWRAMLNRCLYLPEYHPQYKDYKGKGITVCDRWRVFKNFLDDMGPIPTTQHTLDRWPDPEGPYEPGNARWATMKEQGNNRTNNRRLTYKGETKTVSEWADLLGLNQTYISHRLALGWSIEDAIERPVILRPNYGNGKGHHKKKITA